MNYPKPTDTLEGFTHIDNYGMNKQPELKKLHDDYHHNGTTFPALYSNRGQLCDAYDIEINYGKQILDVLNQIGEYSLDKIECQDCNMPDEF